MGSYPKTWKKDFVPPNEKNWSHHAVIKYGRPVPPTVAEGSVLQNLYSKGDFLAEATLQEEVMRLFVK